MTKRLLLAVLLPLIAGFILLAVLLTQQLNSSIPPLIEDASRRQVEARGDEVSRWLEGYRKWLGGIASAQELKTATDLESLVPWLKAQNLNDKAIESLFFAGMDGQTITHAGAKADLSGRGYFQDIVIRGTQDRILTNPVLSLLSGQPIAVIAEAVFDEQGNRKGLLGIALTMEELSNIVSSLEMGAGSYGWVVDGVGMLVAHPAPQARMKINVTDADRQGYQGLDQHGRRFIRGEAGMGGILNLDGDPVTMIWNPIAGTPNWTVGVSVPDDVFTATTRSLLTNVTLLILVVLAVLALVIGFVAQRQVRPIKDMAQRMQDIAEGDADLTQKLEVDRKDELGMLAQSFNEFIARVRQLVADIGQTAQVLASNAEKVEQSSLSMGNDMQHQQTEVDQIAAAMNQLAATVEEVAHHAQAASVAAQQGGEETESGSFRVGTVVESIQKQAITINQTAEEVEKLQASGEQIGEVMNVIRAIAEQTNLLALNAAIEAARAGEAGRGFAVVADEVRTLAARTHESTEQIQSTVDQLRQRITQAVDAMRNSNTHSNQTATDAEAAGTALTSITEAINNIKGMNLQIASATEEQSSTVDELSRNLERIVALSNTTSASANEVASSGTQLNQVARELQALVAQFKV